VDLALLLLPVEAVMLMVMATVMGVGVVVVGTLSQSPPANSLARAVLANYAS